MTYWLAGSDGTRPGLPIGELLAPVPIGALLIVIANDWWWKPSRALPGWLTGKLSDFAGVIVLPLVLTAALALLLRALALAGARVDWTLRRWKLAAAIAITAALVLVVKLSPAAAARAAAIFGERSRIIADPTDLLALPALAVAWWQGRRTIARVPYGRLAWIAARRLPAGPALADALACGADRARLDALTSAVDAWVAGGPAAPVDDALTAVRAG